MLASISIIIARSTHRWRMSCMHAAMTQHDATSSGEGQLCSMVWAHASTVPNRLCHECLSGLCSTGFDVLVLVMSLFSCSGVGQCREACFVAARWVVRFTFCCAALKNPLPLPRNSPELELPCTVVSQQSPLLADAMPPHFAPIAVAARERRCCR